MEKDKVSLFDVMTAPLQGSNLIEASAGTGKTFSIAILVLRLLLRHFNQAQDEKEKTTIYINQILMVTFTTAAVAELESRIRKYIYIAEQYAVSEGDAQDAIREEHPLIARIVDEALSLAADHSEIKQVLKDNLLLLDESNIMTIHSFCQSTLNEFAIETNQLFGVELYTETDKLLEIELNKFWRKHITQLDVSILRQLDLKQKRKDLKEVVQYHLDGKVYAFYSSEKDYAKTDFNELWQRISSELEAEKEIAFSQLQQWFASAAVRDSIDASSAVKKSKEKYLSVLDDLVAFMEVYSSDKSKVKNDLPEDFKMLLDTFIDKYANIVDLVQRLFFVEVNNLAIQEISEGYEQYLSSNNFVTYDQLIEKLHAAIYSSRSTILKEKLNEKYKAVFVDEFQDTDRKQYDIFFETFAQQSILFLIGDPKQSIYGWRKADMLTYFKAREHVQSVYHMNINYRSSKIAIDAMNHFFKPNPRFDTFYYQEEKEHIDYTDVDAPADSGKGFLAYGDEANNGMELVALSNNTEITEQVAALTLQLLTDGNYSLKDRPVEPSDIGIVVRTNGQATRIKAALSQRNIPSVVVNEEKVLTSEGAVDVLYLLHAVLMPSLSKINRFLMVDLVGFNYKELLRVDDNKALDIFQELNSIWIKSGVYPMLIRFVSLFSIEEKWMQKAEGERKLTNFFHITELLNQMEKKRGYAPEELIVWLQRSIDGQEHTGDEYELRMESDENAVKIITIHKSKGLEYNIAIAPFLDLDSNLATNRSFVQFYDKAIGQYVTKDALLLTKEEKTNYQTEQERENRRLVYVAITRAAYKFYVFHSKREKESSLAAFYEALKDEVLATSLLPDRHMEASYSNKNTIHYSRPLEAEHFTLLDTNWHKLSFTGLSYHGERSVKERTKTFASDYDAFVFDQLKFGAASGNLLHSLLEEIDFSSDRNREPVVKNILQRYLPSESESIYPNIELFLDHVLNATIKVDEHSFQLNQISNRRRLSELEFDFPIQSFDYKKLSFILKDFYPVHTRAFDSQQLQGLMNGKIDLFFEHDGRFYILDWKSNYLGYELENYNSESLLQAMDENNYHLQYLIYIVAAKKMLESRLGYFNYEQQFGGVVYLFLRGVRKDNSSGIFTIKPSYKIIASLERLLYL